MKILKNILICSVIFCTSLSASMPSWSLIDREEQSGEILPKNSQEISFFILQANERFQNEVAHLVSTPLSETTFSNTFERWNKARRKIFTKISLLQYVIMTTDQPEVLNSSYEGIESLLNQYVDVSERMEVNRFLFEYAKKAIASPKKLNSYQSYVIDDFISSCEDGLLSQDYPEVEHCRKIVESLTKTPFLSLTGIPLQKVSSSTSSFTILNLNICFLPGKMVLPFGGVAEWKKRVKPISNKIKEIDADIVCLQEVFTDEAAKELYADLKDSYSFFYVAIGPREMNMNVKSLGLPSGLFIASKYEMQKPTFSVFDTVGFPMNYGFFDFLVMKDQLPIAHIYTTHLQSLNLEGFSNIRAEELKQILKKMENDSQVSKELSPARIPYFLCGDLNIPWGTKEPGEDIIQEYFYDNYNLGRCDVSESCRTCTEFFTNYLYKKQEAETNAQILDYALLLDRFSKKDSFAKAFSLKTVVVPMNNYNEPLDALSDHHALLSTIAY